MSSIEARIQQREQAHRITVLTHDLSHCDLLAPFECVGLLHTLTDLYRLWPLAFAELPA